MKYKKTTIGWEDVLRAKIKVDKGVLALLENEELVGTFVGNEKYVHTKINNIPLNVYNPDGVVEGVEIDVVLQMEKLPGGETREPRKRAYITTQPRGLPFETEDVILIFLDFYNICSSGMVDAKRIYEEAMKG